MHGYHGQNWALHDTLTHACQPCTRHPGTDPMISEVFVLFYYSDKEHVQEWFEKLLQLEILCCRIVRRQCFGSHARHHNPLLGIELFNAQTNQWLGLTGFQQMDSIRCSKQSMNTALILLCSEGRQYLQNQWIWVTACQLYSIQGKLSLNFNNKKHLALWAWGQIDNQYNDAGKTITVSLTISWHSFW